MNKKVLLIALSLCGALYSEAQVKKVVKKPVGTAKKATLASVVIKSSLDSVSYAFGYSIAQDLKSRGVTNLNYALLSNAMNDVFKDSKPDLAADKCQQTIYTFLSSINKNKFSGNIAEGTKFLEQNKTKPGVVTLPSGLQYLILQAGTGPKPQVTDEVTVHYKGTLLNGKQFDSSYDRGEPISFPLNQVIPGWTEGVQQMPIGSKYRFFIPYQLAYGEKGAGQEIPPYSVLIFEVELIKFGKETPNVEPKPIK
ncbi:MAG: Peptidylprolyl isomerase [Sphingobacteriales bacterium]|nr:Peptidylprolyl isomerase [Sphingobacteriales bacterium]